MAGTAGTRRDHRAAGHGSNSRRGEARRERRASVDLDERRQHVEPRLARAQRVAAVRVCVAVELGQPAGHARALPGPSTPPAAGPLGSRWPRGGANERHVRQADLQRNRGRSGVGLVGRDLRALEGAGGGGEPSGVERPRAIAGVTRVNVRKSGKGRQRRAKSDGQEVTTPPAPRGVARPSPPPLPLLPRPHPSLTHNVSTLATRVAGRGGKESARRKCATFEHVRAGWAMGREDGRVGSGART